MKNLSPQRKSEIYLKAAAKIASQNPLTNNVVGCCFFLKKCLRFHGYYEDMLMFLPEFQLFEPKKKYGFYWWDETERGYEERILALCFCSAIANRP